MSDVPPEYATEATFVPLDTRVTLAVMRQLVAVQRLGSVGAAARALGVSQPTVSANISRIESVLGFSLVLRSATGTKLTQEGAAIAFAAGAVIAAADEVGRVIAGMSSMPAEPLRIAASLTIAEHLVPRWLANPKISSHLSPDSAAVAVGNSDEVMDWIQKGLADVGFVEGRTIRAGIAHASVARDELVVVVGKRHRWFDRKDPISPEELTLGGLVAREPGSGTREVLEDALARVGLALPSMVPTFGSTAAIITAVRHGGAMAVVSELAVAAEIEAGLLRSLAVPKLKLTRNLTAIWLDSAPLQGGLARLVSNISSAGSRRNDETDRSACLLM